MRTEDSTIQNFNSSSTLVLLEQAIGTVQRCASFPNRPLSQSVRRIKRARNRERKSHSAIEIENSHKFPEF